MRTPWYEQTIIETLNTQWDSFPTSAGVYMIISDRPIPRIGGVDDRSIIYIGKAKNLRDRLWDFWKANHSASGFLWRHPTMASIILNKPTRSFNDVMTYLGKLKVRYSTPIDVDLLERAERALLFAYIRSFGEAPPLNLILPKRWDEFPPAQDLLWAERALF